MNGLTKGCCTLGGAHLRASSAVLLQASGAGGGPEELIKAAHVATRVRCLGVQVAATDGATSSGRQRTERLSAIMISSPVGREI